MTSCCRGGAPDREGPPSLSCTLVITIVANPIVNEVHERHQVKRLHEIHEVSGFQLVGGGLPRPEGDLQHWLYRHGTHELHLIRVRGESWKSMYVPMGFCCPGSSRSAGGRIKVHLSTSFSLSCILILSLISILLCVDTTCVSLYRYVCAC